MKFLFALLLIANSLMAQKRTSIKQFEWLVGKWKLDDKEVFEKWQVLSDTMIAGISFHIEYEEGEKGEFEKEMK